MELINDDCLKVMQKMADNSVDLIFTINVFKILE